MPTLSTIGASSAKAFGFGNIPTLRLTISTDQTNLNLRTYAVANGWNIGQRLEVITTAGVDIVGSNTSTPALTVSGSLPRGVRLINNGRVIGRGGNGGAGSINSNGGAGGAGGTAISASTKLFITNNGTFAGGGGGGGGGAGSNYGDL